MLLMADKFMGRKERQEKEENELNNRFKKKGKRSLPFVTIKLLLKGRSQTVADISTSDHKMISAFPTLCLKTRVQHNASTSEQTSTRELELNQGLNKDGN